MISTKENRGILTSTDSKYIAIYIALKPVYIFRSGSMQICDLVLALYVLKNLFTKKKVELGPQISKPMVLLLLLVYYQITVNSCWYLLMPDKRFLMSSVYCIFNYLAMYVFIYDSIYNGIDSFFSGIYIGCLISSVIATIGTAWNQGVSSRGASFFNNPNQLGLYAILMLTILLFIRESTPPIGRVVIILSSVYCVLSSGSKAAFLGLIITGSIYILFGDFNMDIKKRLLVVILFSLLVYVLYQYIYSSNPTVLEFINRHEVLRKMKDRIRNYKTERDSNLMYGRGYARVREVGYHFITGMGEGGYGRFRYLRGLEVHSSLINMYISYGLIGIIGLLSFIGYIVTEKGYTAKNLLYLSGILSYSFTHNCLRNTLIWLIFAIIIVKKQQISRSKRVIVDGYGVDGFTFSKR